MRRKELANTICEKKYKREFTHTWQIVEHESGPKVIKRKYNTQVLIDREKKDAKR